MSVDFQTVKPLTDREYRLIRDLVYSEAGIHLSPAKKALIAGRLGRRVRELNLASLGEYYEWVRQHEAEKVTLLDAITTNETHFFRERGHFDFLCETILPRWRAAALRGDRSKTFRAWSAACSTGEEPFSLAMCLLSHLPAEEGFTVEIFASDISTKVLAKARVGEWPVRKAAEIPSDFLKRYMLKGVGSQAGKMRVGPELAQAVTFDRVNLLECAQTVPAGWDIVFCRNVLIYFDAASKARVMEQLIGRLADHGLLFLGHAESLLGMTERLRGVSSATYAKRAPTPAA